MKPKALIVCAVVATLIPNFTSHASPPKVDSQDVASTDADVIYVVSDRGVHIAAKTRKGSRFVVTIDGVAGPKFDDLLTETLMYVDPRPHPFVGTISSRHGGDQQTTRPVIFSKDGNHHAYVCRMSEEWVVIKDGQEYMRLPAPKYGQDFRMEFVGDDAKHFIFARIGYPGYEFWFDGKQWPGTYSSGGSGIETLDPLISPDGEHVAYPAQIDRQNRTVILDGKDAGYYAEKLQFTPDSKHLISVVQKPGGASLLVDGKTLYSPKQLNTYYVASAGMRIASVIGHHYPDGSLGQVLVVDGKPVEATLCKNGIQAFAFSPDGKHYAAVCGNAPNILWVVTDGKKGQQYDQIALPVLGSSLPSITYSPDSAKLVYVAHGGGKNFMVINGEESDDAFDNIGGFLFSPDGKRFVYNGTQMSSGKNNPIFIDGKAERFEKGVSIDQFDFSPDSSRYAYLGAGNYGGAMYIDGKPASLAAYDFRFSPDSKHIAVSGFNPADNGAGLWIDGVRVYRGERNPEYMTFSADSQHIYWSAYEPDKTKPGSYIHVTYADGQKVTTGDPVNQFRLVTVPIGYSPYTIHPGWQATGQSGLTCLNPVGDTIKRSVITPTDTSVAALVANPVK